MNRRTFLCALALEALSAARQSEAQQAGRIARVGVLGFGRPPSPEQIAQSPFVAGMKDHGWIEGQNLVVERRYGESADQLRAAAAELGSLKVDVLVVPSAGLATIARLEARNTPIVIIASGDDLVRIGLVASLARPGGTITGSQILQDDLFGKRLQLLKDLVPHLSRVASLDELVTMSEDLTSKERARRQQQDPVAARSLGLELHFYTAARPEDFPSLFGDMVKKGDQGLVVESTPFMFLHRNQIIDLTAIHRIPAMYNNRSYVEPGGLVSYGPDSRVLGRRAASFVDRILKGAKPGDLPIEQPTTFELVINLKTAKALA